MGPADVTERTERTDQEELARLRASLVGRYVRADRVAEARGRLRRGEVPADDELARAIVADATG